jgi:hypothetical protein
MSRVAQFFLKLPESIGSRFLRFWLDPDAYDRGDVRGNGGDDEQCPNCGASINENYTFLSDHKSAAQCQCGQTVKIVDGSDLPIY